MAATHTRDPMTRVIVLASLVVICVAAVLLRTWSREPKPPEALSLRLSGLAAPAHNRLDNRYVDADGDLVADPPPAAEDQLDPRPLQFSYIAGEDGEHQRQVWRPFVEHLATAVGRPVEQMVFSRPEDQLRALAAGRLQVTGLATGEVPRAVNLCGFVPVCSIGDAYRMLLIVRKNSPVVDLKDIRGRALTVTHSGSNSGCKAPLVLLRDECGLLAVRDFKLRFSYGHDASIAGIASGEYEIAAVASDLLSRAEANGVISPQAYRTIYESEAFPPACLGYVHNLEPQLADDVRRALTTFGWAGTDLADELASSGTTFQPIVYKDDWALIRRIDDASGTVHRLAGPGL